MTSPPNHLDIRHQFEILALPAHLGITAVIALHDLNLAARYCGYIHVLHQGRQIRSGTPDQVLTPELLADVYRVTADITINTHTGRPTVQFAP